MISDWTITAQKRRNGVTVFRAQHTETDVEITGPITNTTPLNVPDGRLTFYVTNRGYSFSNYSFQKPIRRAFATAIIHERSDRHVFLTEIDFALIKLAAQ